MNTEYTGNPRYKFFTTRLVVVNLPRNKSISQGSGKYWEILGITGKYWEILGITGKYWELPGNTGNYREILGITGKYWEIPGNRKAMANGHIIMGGKYYGLVFEPKQITLK